MNNKHKGSDMKINEIVVIVVGASGGIGSAITESLVAEGAKVALAARTESKLQTLAREVGKPDQTLVVPTDVTNTGSVDTLFADVVKKWGRIDAVVIASGTYLGTSLDDSLQVLQDDLRRMLEVNILGAATVAYAATKYMLMHRDGIIINLSSHAAFRKDLAGSSGYAGTKAGISHLLACVSSEIKAKGIRIFDLQPSTVYTPEMLAFIPEGKEHLAIQPEQIGDRVVSLIKNPPETDSIDIPMIGELGDF